MPTKKPIVKELKAQLEHSREKYKAYDENRKAKKTRIVLWVENETASIIDNERSTQSRNEWIENCVLNVLESGINEPETVPQHPPQKRTCLRLCLVGKHDKADYGTVPS